MRSTRSRVQSSIAVNWYYLVRRPAGRGPGRSLQWLNEFDVDLDLVGG